MVSPLKQLSLSLLQYLHWMARPSLLHICESTTIMRERRLLACVLAAAVAVGLLVALPAARRQHGPVQLYGGHHWGGVGSEGYSTSSWDNTGWNEHYHPRDGASMDSESMEPYTWRKGPRVNDEYTFDDGGDPTVDPGKSWEPPIMVGDHVVYKGALQSLAGVDLGEESEAEMLMHPRGDAAEGVWIEPPSSARSVLGNKAYDAYVRDAMTDKGFKQSLVERSAAPVLVRKGPSVPIRRPRFV